MSNVSYTIQRKYFRMSERGARKAMDRFLYTIRDGISDTSCHIAPISVSIKSEEASIYQTNVTGASIEEIKKNFSATVRDIKENLTLKYMFARRKPLKIVIRSQGKLSGEYRVKLAANKIEIQVNGISEYHNRLDIIFWPYMTYTVTRKSTSEYSRG